MRKWTVGTLVSAIAVCGLCAAPADAHRAFRRKHAASKVQKCPAPLVPCEQAYQNRGGAPEGGWTCAALPKCVAWDEFNRYDAGGSNSGGGGGNIR